MVDIFLIDNWHEEIGCSLYDADDPTLDFEEVKPGEYTTGGTMEVEDTLVMD
jgi:hypothetical protein